MLLKELRGKKILGLAAAGRSTLVSRETTIFQPSELLIGLSISATGNRRKLLHFVVVGGGPTGVEYAAELHDLIHEDLSRLYPSLEKDATITVVQSADHILNSFDRRISDYAEKKFARDGVDVKIGWRVSEVTDKCICLKSKNTGNIVQQMPYGMVVWSTGVVFVSDKSCSDKPVPHVSIHHLCEIVFQTKLVLKNQCFMLPFIICVRIVFR